MNSNEQKTTSRMPQRRSKAQQQTLELLTTGMYVAFWAEVGVLTRIYVAKVFSDGCMGYWGFCLLSQGKLSLLLLQAALPSTPATPCERLAADALQATPRSAWGPTSPTWQPTCWGVSSRGWQPPQQPSTSSTAARAWGACHTIIRGKPTRPFMWGSGPASAVP